MMRLFTLTTISSTIAARAGPTAREPATSASVTTSAAGTDAAPRSSVAVLPLVFEGEDGPVDMDLGLLLQVGQVAIHHLVGLLPEQVGLDPLLDGGEIGRLRFLFFHQLDDEESPGIV